MFENLDIKRVLELALLVQLCLVVFLVQQVRIQKLKKSEIKEVI